VQKTVLIVEDQFLLAMDLSHTCEEDGWQVLGPVASVQAALQLLEQQLPAAAVLDVNLRDKLVTPVAEALRLHKVPFVVTTAVANPEQLCGEVLAGAPLLSKPVDPCRLLMALRQLTSL
jgi:DNA-binding response OmpR family regulator